MLPYFSIFNGDLKELSPQLKSFALASRMLGLTDEQMVAIAEAGETAALLKKATQQRIDEDKRIGYITAHEENMRKLQQGIAETFSIKKQLLAVLEELAKQN